ncbi:MAG: alkaline phosphatase family protein [Bacteroidales bacterium]|nr:MAG: alkaline phosphatase family protein [Bacteroidales bacterium]
MKARFVFLIKYFLFWLVFFAIARLLFMVYQLSQTSQIFLSDWYSIFIRGAWMDISLIGYILLLSGLFLSALSFSNGKWIMAIFKYYTISLLAIFSFIVVSDLELYRNWGFRVDATPLFFLKTPGEAFASTPILIVAMLLVIWVLFLLVSYWSYQKWVVRKDTIIEKGRWWFIPAFIFFSALMIIPIRGNFGIAPMNPGKVYYSQNMYCNHAALNSVWNMIYSLSKSGSMNKKYPDYIDKEKAKTIAAELMLDNGTSLNVLKSNRPNVVIILLESFTSKVIEPLGGLKGVTPNFNELSKQGILFNHVFASGDRSDKGIVATVSGFPAQSTKSIIKYPLKSQKLPTISGVFDSLGYRTTFYYGGNPDFANIRSYLYSAKFRNMITQDDFPKSYRNSKWGVHDEYVFERLIADCDTANGAFFKMCFTLTSHEPFEIPSRPKFDSSDEQTKFINAIHYTDSCIGVFFNEARTKEWYKNTLFILIADHGHRYPGGDINYSLNKFKIPMLWLGGAVSRDSLVIQKMGSQVDLAATLLCQIGVKSNQFKFSKNLLSNGCKPYAYYVFNDGFGFVADSASVIFDHTSKRFILKEGSDIERVSDEAFSYLSYYQDIFLRL